MSHKRFPPALPCVFISVFHCTSFHQLIVPVLTLTSFSYQTLDGRIVVRSHARVSSLTLKDIQYTDAGEYICIASNTIGQDSQAMYLEVQCKWGPFHRHLIPVFKCHLFRQCSNP